MDFLQGLSILGRVSSFPAGVMVQKHGLYFTGAVGLIAGSAGNILFWVVGNADAPGTALIPCFLVAGKTRAHPTNTSVIEIHCF